LEGLAQAQSGKEPAVSQALKNTSPEAVLNQSDITKYLRSVNLQIDVSKYFYSLQSKRGAQPLEAANLSLFANQKQKSGIQDTLLLPPLSPAQLPNFLQFR